ncbi:MAG TPA: IS256 family transposase, partial [Candidatus Acidoferrum sp.]|nr:IS256 family transposase [Candidatus Acidoferrum sp.]
HTVRRRWREVKTALREDLTVWTRHYLKRLLEQTLEEEREVYLRAARHERTPGRQDYRNGYYTRDLGTELGLVRHLRVPRTRTRGFLPQGLDRYQRRRPAVAALIREAFLAGASTRRVGPLLAPLLGEQVSATTVSRITQSLDADVRAFHDRPLPRPILYPLLDGIRLRVKTPAGGAHRLVLCAYGLTPAGQRRLLSFRQAKAESAAAWGAFLQDLYARGLSGESLRLVVTDGSPGLHAALDIVYPYVARQRCWVHKLRNVAAKLPRRHQAACLGEVAQIYGAATERAARHAFHAWAGRWRRRTPTAVACVERDLAELLSCFRCPPTHRKKIRTTNAIERAFREVRRRVRPMTCFTNGASCDRIVYAVITHLNAQWELHPLKEFIHNS